MSENNLSEFEFAKSIAWQMEPSRGFVYILDNKNRQWYHLEDISKDIWLQIGQHKNLNSIVETLMQEYEVDYETLYSDIKDYIYELEEEGLVTHNG